MGTLTNREPGAVATGCYGQLSEISNPKISDLIWVDRSIPSLLLRVLYEFLEHQRPNTKGPTEP
jgi:hypothetical protein